MPNKKITQVISICFCGLDYAMLRKCVFIYKMQLSLSCALQLLSQYPITLGRQEKLLPLIFHKS